MGLMHWALGPSSIPILINPAKFSTWLKFFGINQAEFSLNFVRIRLTPLKYGLSAIAVGPKKCTKNNQTTLPVHHSLKISKLSDWPDS